MSLRFIDYVREKMPDFAETFATLMPFDDVISAAWCDEAGEFVGIGIDVDGCVYPSGCYHSYGARIYKDRVVMFNDTTDKKGECVREEYVSDLPRLWAFLRQLPRPMCSFGKVK